MWDQLTVFWGKIYNLKMHVLEKKKNWKVKLLDMWKSRQLWPITKKKNQSIETTCLKNLI
jgi:hypothetical protein